MSDAAMSKAWTLPGEQWATVPFDPGYQVSTFARARSLDRLVTCRVGPPQRHKGQILSVAVGTNGYPVVGLSRGRKYPIGTLMLSAFVCERPFPGAEARHLNDNRLDNRLDNLAWGTRQDNADDQARNWPGYVLRSKCPFGHRYVPQNMVPSALPNRACLACSRARSITYKARKAGVAVDHQAVSDHYFRLIVGTDVAQTGSGTAE